MINSHMHRKVSIGDIVRLRVIDWCRHGYQMASADVEAQATLKVATIYGMIAAIDELRVALVNQSFEDGAYRDVLSVPACCVINYEILGNIEDARFIQQDAEPIE